MYLVGTAGGIPIMAPSGSPISFFNSPYVGHRLATSVDIYTSSQEWGGDVQSPVTGVVTKIRRMKMGEPKAFRCEQYDYAVGIQTGERSETIVRILHCKPSVSLGEHVDAGDRIGSSIRSGFFCYWTSPHSHVEVMTLSNFHRSSQSFLLEVRREPCKFEKKASTTQGGQTSLTVTTIEPDFMVGALAYSPIVTIDESVGHPAVDAAGNLLGIMDTGFPHYPVCGVRRADRELYLGAPDFQSIPLGKSITTREGLSTHEQLTGFRVFMDNIRVRGVSTYIYRRENLLHGRLPLKVIPLTPGGFAGRVSEGDVVDLRWNEQT